MKKKKLIFIGAGALVVIGVAVFLLTRNGATATTTITKVNAVKGDISNTISSSGTVQPIEEYVITTAVTGEILSDNVEIGQEYQKGDLLYTIDSTDAQNAITRAENSLEKQKLAYEQSQENLTNLIITAPFSGRISKLYVEDGDKINNGTKIVDLIDSSTFKVTLPFLTNDTRYINKGNKVNVYVESTGEEVIGSVKNVSTGSYSNSYGAMVSDVEIEFNNPGNFSDELTVSAMIGNYACNMTGTAKYKNQTTITAETGGTVTKLNYSEGDMVDSYSIILELEDANTVLSEKTSAFSLRDAEIALNEAKEDLADCTITSPITGVVTYKYYKGGETINNNNSTTLAVVADMSKLSFTMSIDELDIKNIELGQEVIVTADALENQTFSGKITNINIIGSSSSGVTTYPVTVEIEEYEGLLPGMNVSAEIISEQVTDVVKVPTSAVSRGDVVLVKEEFAKSLEVNKDYDKKSVEVDSSNDNDKRKNNYEVGEIVEMPNTPDGYKYIKVTTGLSDSEYIEITGGISEGNEVYVVTTVTKGSTDSTSGNNASSMFGGMGGGAMTSMPTGGSMPSMPSGGGNFGGGGNRGGGGNFGGGR